MTKVSKFTQHLVEDLRGALQKLQAKVDKGDKEASNTELLLTVSVWYNFRPKLENIECMELVRMRVHSNALPL